MPRRPGVECRNYGPSYPVETRAEYLKRIKSCRRLFKDDIGEFYRQECKREAHFVLSGGRDKSRFPERKAPSISLDTAKRLAFGKDMGGPWDSRSQSPAVRAYTDRLAKDRKSDIEAVRDAIADYQATTPKVAGGHGFRVPLSPEPLIERGMPSRAARILVFRARDRIFLPPLEHSKFTEDVTGKPRIDYKNLSNINLFDLPVVLDRISRRRAKKGLKRQPRDQEIAVSNPFDYDYDGLFADVKANPRHRRKHRKSRPVPWKGAKGQFSINQRKHQGHQPANRKNPSKFAGYPREEKHAYGTHLFVGEVAGAEVSLRDMYDDYSVEMLGEGRSWATYGHKKGWELVDKGDGFSVFRVPHGDIKKVFGARAAKAVAQAMQRSGDFYGVAETKPRRGKKRDYWDPKARAHTGKRRADDLSEAQIAAGFGGAEARDNLARENGRRRRHPRPLPWRGEMGQFSTTTRKHRGYQPINRKNPADLSDAQILAGFGGAEARDKLARENGRRRQRPVPWRGAKGQFSTQQRRHQGHQPVNRTNPRENDEAPWGYDMPPGYPYGMAKGQYGTYRAVPPTNRRNPADSTKRALLMIAKKRKGSPLKAHWPSEDELSEHEEGMLVEITASFAPDEYYAASAHHIKGVLRDLQKKKYLNKYWDLTAKGQTYIDELGLF